MNGGTNCTGDNTETHNCPSCPKACPNNPRIVVDEKHYDHHYKAWKVLHDHQWYNRMYWVAKWRKGPWGKPAPPPSGTGGFTVDLGCVRQINGFRLRNSYGYFGKDGTRGFSVAISSTDREHGFKTILTNELPNPRCGFWCWLNPNKHRHGQNVKWFGVAKTTGRYVRFTCHS